MNELTHLDANNNPQMVDVGDKTTTKRSASAEARVWLPGEVLEVFDGSEIQSAKGPVFQTAIIAGIQAAKKTSELIPMCHLISLDKVGIDIKMDGSYARIHSTVKCSGKTGVEMEALQAVSSAALVIYDMCKGLSHDIRIEGIQLIAKSGGKRDFDRG